MKREEYVRHRVAQIRPDVFEGSASSTRGLIYQLSYDSLTIILR